MFCLMINAMSRDELMEAMFILSYYHVNINTYSNGESAESTYMVVSAIDTDHPGQERDAQEDLRMAEMAFQMNFRQHGNLCLHCEDEEDTTCGHLTFTNKI